ncbi:MAG: MOSC domain-containing protein [Desulfobacterales bacterium]|jgi:MOSC domain-containing protein YiiM
MNAKQISGGQKRIGRVVAVSVSDRKGVKKNNTDAGRLIENFGLAGDAHAGDWHRQVSLLGVESIAKIRAKGLDVAPGDFAENITTAGITLWQLPLGTRLRLGDQVLAEVTQIGKQCHNRCAIFHQVGDCVMPREGIFARVIKGGRVRPGDAIQACVPEAVATAGDPRENDDPPSEECP